MTAGAPVGAGEAPEMAGEAPVASAGASEMSAEAPAVAAVSLPEASDRAWADGQVPSVTAAPSSATAGRPSLREGAKDGKRGESFFQGLETKSASFSKHWKKQRFRIPSLGKLPLAHGPAQDAHTAARWKGPPDQATFNTKHACSSSSFVLVLEVHISQIEDEDDDEDDGGERLTPPWRGRGSGGSRWRTGSGPHTRRRHADGARRRRG